MLLLHVPKNCLIHLAILIQHWHAMHKQAKNRHINQETERVVVLESWSRGTSRTILSNLGPVSYTHLTLPTILRV